MTRHIVAVLLMLKFGHGVGRLEVHGLALHGHGSVVVGHLVTIVVIGHGRLVTRIQIAHDHRFTVRFTLLMQLVVSIESTYKQTDMNR